jgi:hypothetical protein
MLFKDMTGRSSKADESTTHAWRSCGAHRTVLLYVGQYFRSSWEDITVLKQYFQACDARS